jgi:hypothetical protein
VNLLLVGAWSAPSGRARDEDRFGELEARGQVVDELVLADEHLVARTRLEPAIGIAC